MVKIVKSERQNLGLFLASLAILGVIGLQLYTAKHLRDFWPKYRSLQALHRLLKAPEKPFLWPFIDYPMYSYPNYLGDDIKQYVILGILPDSTEVRIQAEDLGLNYWIFMYGFKEALRKNDRQDIKNFIQLYESRNNKKLIGVRLENHPLILTKEGVEPGKPKVVTDFKVNSLEEKK
ncbi:hypothetical protein HC931_01495 [Candidatus Gracilibacteria bacterium]|nr:hypothetical protein [Candidatus Gracilibacteria bacterium]NJM86376.1 hypothetical protein [Hydrococcus sp. RU_2_2]